MDELLVGDNKGVKEPGGVTGIDVEADVGTTGRTGVFDGTDVGPALGFSVDTVKDAPTGADGSWAAGDIEGLVSFSNVLGFPHKVSG